VSAWLIVELEGGMGVIPTDGMRSVGKHGGWRKIFWVEFRNGVWMEMEGRGE
jgi:hypothetical protein